MNKLTWDYDLKRKLLGNNYREDNPIKNILLAQDENNFQDESKDYYEYDYYKRGHLENYKYVDDIFKKVYPSTYIRKDIMNSFWNTYKFFLQLEYPDVFTPIGKISDNKPLEKRNNNFEEFEGKSSNRDYYTPQKDFVHKKYKAYFAENFPSLKIHDREIKEPIYDVTWAEFLLDNFDYFKKVNDQEDLKKFARLTHSIGNIDIVPKGFNGGRGNNEYWDWGMMELKEFFSTISPLIWKNYVNVHELTDYVEDNYDVKPFWDNHLTYQEIVPKSQDNIIEFLKAVNSKIENRGKKILSLIGD